jgi:hypothetical protein
MTLGPSTPRRAALGQTPTEIVRNAQAYATLGVDTLVISAGTVDPREARSTLEMIANDLLPAL